MGRPINTAIKFWTNVAIGLPHECWNWQGCLNQKGYGKFMINYRHLIAHRISWTLNIGPIPDGKHVLHRCDNPKCVNPNHLFLGTVLDNNRDRKEKKRYARNEAHAQAKLTWEAVAKIRERLSQKVKKYVIAKEFGVNRNLIGDIANGRAWRHDECPIK